LRGAFALGCAILLLGSAKPLARILLAQGAAFMSILPKQSLEEWRKAREWLDQWRKETGRTDSLNDDQIADLLVAYASGKRDEHGQA
jgi:hypothetical protein